MIKTEVGKDHILDKSKFIRQSFSPKKNIITFSLDTGKLNRNSINPSQINKRSDSSSKQTSERLKKKVERQKIVEKFDEITMSPQRYESNHLGKISEMILMKRSNLTKMSSSATFHKDSNSPSQTIRKHSIIKSSRTQQAQNLFGNPPKANQLYYKEFMQRNMQVMRTSLKNFKDDVNRISLKKKQEELFTCKSLRKSSQIQFCNDQIAQLINRKGKNKLQFGDDHSDDQTSFELVLKKIKSTKMQEIETENIFVKNKYQNQEDNAKNYKVIITPKQVNYNYLIGDSFSNKESLISHSSQVSQKLDLKSALQWSNKRVDLMKYPFVKMNDISKKDRNVKVISSSKVTHKKDYKIQGWNKS